MNRWASAWLAAAASLVITASLWVPEAHAFLGFAVPLLGRLGIVAPVGALPAALLAAGFMLAVPAYGVSSALGPTLDSPLRRRWSGADGRLTRERLGER